MEVCNEKIFVTNKLKDTFNTSQACKCYVLSRQLSHTYLNQQARNKVFKRINNLNKC